MSLHIQYDTLRANLRGQKGLKYIFKKTISTFADPLPLIIMRMVFGSCTFPLCTGVSNNGWCLPVCDFVLTGKFWCCCLIDCFYSLPMVARCLSQHAINVISTYMDPILLLLYFPLEDEQLKGCVSTPFQQLLTLSKTNFTKVRLCWWLWLGQFVWTCFFFVSF